ncbi:MAG: hypothetical protein MZV63_05810 [Marinilabiliales bacterium]|nr:hypothetical protein [Marinilabiliales bacterium]
MVRQGKVTASDLQNIPPDACACMVFARSAAMAFNRYADHRFDSMNPRTASQGDTVRQNLKASMH